jgi:hypothetical protein
MDSDLHNYKGRTQTVLIFIIRATEREREETWRTNKNNVEKIRVA